MKIYIYILLLLSIVTSLRATKSYTLQELTRLALKRSELIQIKNSELKSIDGRISQAKIWQNPKITTNIGAKTEDTNSGHSYSLNFSQPFYFPGKQNLKGKIQETFKRDANLNLEDTRRFIFHKVIFLAFAYKEASEHVKHLDERRNRFKIIQKYLHSRVFVSPQKKLEKILVENKILLLEKDILGEKIKKKTIWEELNLYLGLNSPIDIQAKWFVKGISLKLATLQQDLKKSPILLARKNILARKNLQKSLAKKAKYPDFSLSAIYSEEKTIRTERFFGGGITFHLPLWNLNQGRISQYQEELSAIKTKTSFLKKKVLAGLKVLFVEYENKRILIKKYPINLIKTIHKQMSLADREFKKGRIGTLSYLELENSLSEVHTAIFESQVEYLQSYLKILSLTGSMNFQEEK